MHVLNGSVHGKSKRSYIRWSNVHTDLLSNITRGGGKHDGELSLLHHPVLAINVVVCERTLVQCKLYPLRFTRLQVNFLKPFQLLCRSINRTLAIMYVELNHFGTCHITGIRHLHTCGDGFVITA